MCITTIIASVVINAVYRSVRVTIRQSVTFVVTCVNRLIKDNETILIKKFYVHAFTSV